MQVVTTSLLFLSIGDLKDSSKIILDDDELPSSKNSNTKASGIV